jgi:hypothetical protein
MKFIISLGAILVGAGSALAADMPNMLGTWIQVKHDGIYSGTASNPAPVKIHRSPPEAPVKMVINYQDGNLFSGESFYNKDNNHTVEDKKLGLKSLFTGVIKEDGKSFLRSDDFAIVTGEIVGDKINHCYASIKETTNFAGCSVFERVK